MRNRIDLLPVTWHQLNVSAFNRVWIKLGFGVQARARRSTQGFDLRIRYGTNDVIQKSRVEVREVPWRAGKQLRPTLVCSVCSQPTTKMLYLGSDFRFSCARCLGVPSWKIRMPMTWDLGEEVRFRRLLKRKLDQDILQFELAALRSLSPADFFASRPYLVPEWVARVEGLDVGLHKKLLKTLHGKYRSVMMRRRVQLLNEREDEWLMDELLKVFGKAAIITKKEITWLRNRKDMLSRKDHSLRTSELGSKPGEMESHTSEMTLYQTQLETERQPQLRSEVWQQERSRSLKIPPSSTQDSIDQTLKSESQSLSDSPGPQPGSTLEESSSPPSETASSSSRMSSSPGTIASDATEEELLAAINATVKVTTPE